MKHRLLLIAALWGLAMHAAAQETKPGSQAAAQMNREVRIKMGYLLYLPKDYDSKPAWPLMLFLHGAGERGTDLELVKKHGPPKRIAAGKEFPFIVVSPQCPDDQWWEAVELAALLDEIVSKYKVDEDRIYVTGLSMGGFGTFRLAFYSPHRFAALAPICGGGEIHWAKQMAHLPVWAFHGAKDKTVEVERSQEMVDALQKAGGNPRLTIYPDVGHDSWTQTYDNPELYEWLLQHTRTKQEAKP